MYKFYPLLITIDWKPQRINKFQSNKLSAKAEWLSEYIVLHKQLTESLNHKSSILNKKIYFKQQIYQKTLQII